MAVSQNAFISPQSIKTATAVLVTASTDIDDAPTTSVLLVTAGANGARLTKISAIPRATVGATMIQIYLSKDNGTTQRLIDTALMAAHTVANTTEIPTTDFGYSDLAPMMLEQADRLYVATSVSLAGGIIVKAEWADY